MTMTIEIPNLTDSQRTFNAMQNNLLTVNTAVNTLQENEKENEKRIAKLNEIVVIGNGEPALRETVRNHAVFVNDVKYWMRFVIGLVIAQLVAFAAASVIAYVKFLPVLEKLAQNK